MDILLLNPPSNLKEMLGVGALFVQKYEPLGLLYIAAVLRDAGYAVRVIDADAENLTFEDVQKRIDLKVPSLIGITTLTCAGAFVYRLGAWMKQTYPDVTVVLGNVHASVFADVYLKGCCCDLVVHGEGEYVMREIAQVCERGGSFASLSSVSYCDAHGECHTNGSPAFISDLSRVPYPARDLVDQTLYGMSEISNHAYIGKKGSVSKTMFTSRGCQNRCYFCVVHNNQKQRFASPAYVVDELEFLEKEYNASYVTIMDSLFMGDRARVLEICREIQKRRLSIKWGCDAHVRYVTPELVRAMQDAQCYALDFGIESGVDRLLKVIKKNTTVKQIEDALHCVRTHSRIKMNGLFILGLPSETYDEACATIDFAKRLPLEMAQFSILTPYPGSPLFNDLKQSGALDTGVRSDGSVELSVWDLYSAYVSFTDKDPIWVTPSLSSEEVRDLQKKAQREFYLRPYQIACQIKRLRLHNIGSLIRIALKGFF
jgi:radical SAM superfamily enzyme YgiQ (UPF0313 family)